MEMSGYENGCLSLSEFENGKLSPERRLTPVPLSGIRQSTPSTSTRETSPYSTCKAGHIALHCSIGRRKGVAKWDELAFSKRWSHGLAYALGVIAGDGTIHPKRIVIELAPKDADILEAVCGILKASPVRIRLVQRRNQKEPTLKLDLCSPVASYQLIGRLGLPGFGPKHSKLQIPEGLPDTYLPDFVRGFLDTDGSINQSGPNSPVAQIYSHSLVLLSQMRTRVGKVLGVDGLGAIHLNSGVDRQGRPRQGGAWVMTGYEAQAFVRWLWPAHRKWIGGARKAMLAKNLILGWRPKRAQKRKTGQSPSEEASTPPYSWKPSSCAAPRRTRRSDKPRTRTILD